MNKTSSEKERRKSEKISSQEEKRIAIKQALKKKTRKTQIVVTYLVLGWGLEGRERHRHPSN
jgi:hypothetical protein